MNHHHQWEAINGELQKCQKCGLECREVKFRGRIRNYYRTETIPDVPENRKYDRINAWRIFYYAPCCVSAKGTD